ncbi:uncharacterized protein LOC142310357 isoform X2 [Anomaloglossus baeobatrachus]|uniref:uncharacterized protein LOC142310357 isoform X2 n=1 Tax=Anomaloglossus baeobatrachus TaxID=238106 RepID=UPI003F4FF558
MFWGQTRSLLLQLLIIHGVWCADLLEASCSRVCYLYGNSVTLTCDVTHKLENITVLNKTDSRLFEYNLLTMGSQTTKDGKMTIAYADNKVTVTTSKDQFCGEFKYWLFLDSGNSSFHNEPIDIVSGCSRNSKNKELVCEVETMQENATIVCKDNDARVYQEIRKEKLSEKNLQIHLNTTKEMENKDICCAVSSDIDSAKEENSFNQSLETNSLSDTKTAPFLKIGILAAVALVATVFGYLILRRKRIILIDDPEAENTPKPLLLPL